MFGWPKHLEIPRTNGIWMDFQSAVKLFACFPARAVPEEVQERKTYLAQDLGCLAECETIASVRLLRCKFGYNIEQAGCLVVLAICQALHCRSSIPVPPVLLGPFPAVSDTGQRQPAGFSTL